MAKALLNATLRIMMDMDMAAPKGFLGSVAGLLDHKAKLRRMCSISFFGKHVPGKRRAAAV